MDQVVDMTLPNEEWTALSTWRKRQNYNSNVAMIQRDMEHGRAGKWVCFDLDRSANAIYNAQLFYDKVGPLRCNGPHYFIICLDGITAQSFDSRPPIPCGCRCHRLLSISERFELQGHDSDVLHCLRGACLQRHASGNAYPVPMLGAVTIPLMTTTMMARAPNLVPAQVDALVSQAVYKCFPSVD